MSTIKTNKLAHTANGASVYTLPQTDGSANQVLKTDGSGNLSWVTPDYVKLASASGDLNAYELTFDNLDVATYRAFDLIGVFQPNNDAETLRLRYRTGGASGSNVTSSGYHYGFTVPYPVNSTGVTSNDSQSKMILTTTIGNHTSEGIHLNMRVSFAISGDSTTVTNLGNSVTWTGTYLSLIHI